MKIYLATDHAGFKLKEKIYAFLKEKGYPVEDCGAHEYIPSDDYPDFISKAAKQVSEDPENSRGIILGGSGEAEMIVANKFPGVRCALFYKPAIPTEAADITGRKSTDPYEIIRLTREHNNTNMLSLAGRFLTYEEVCTAIEKWLAEPFPAAERHVRRLEKIRKIEEAIHG